MWGVLGILFAFAGVVLLVVRTGWPPARQAGLGLLGAAAVCLMLGSIRIVPAGHVGVPVVFGEVADVALDDGIGIVNPFAQLVRMSVRTETYTMSAKLHEGSVAADDSVTALSRDGLRMPLEITVAYRLTGKDAPWVYRNLGADYVVDIIRPSARTSVRDAVSEFTAQEAYSTRRDELEIQMQERLRARIKDLFAKYPDFRGTGVEVQQVMLREIQLPERVKDAIEAKLQAEQESQRMQFVLQKETQEAERKRIEAQGIRDFQATVRQGLDDQLLRWKGIEATESLAKSQNSKVVVIGSGSSGLPLILNTQ